MNTFLGETVLCCQAFSSLHFQVVIFDFDLYMCTCNLHSLLQPPALFYANTFLGIPVYIQVFIFWGYNLLCFAQIVCVNLYVDYSTHFPFFHPGVYNIL